MADKKQVEEFDQIENSQPTTINQNNYFTFNIFLDLEKIKEIFYGR